MLKLYRYSSQSVSTLGFFLLFGKFQCYSIEDTFREEKIKHETRIKAGKYKIKLRNFGKHFERYSKKFPGHKGTLWVQDVPEFTDILIHIGTEPKHSSGCILTGSKVNNNRVEKGVVKDSTKAYLDLYFKLLPFLEECGEIDFEIIDLDEPYKH